ncbi:MAG TPA: DUF4118 domain-containing protein, partial [Armatimonadota bacterium]|nr:DUF4118 domain-containing protein [Armatimonadota bacterium]
MKRPAGCWAARYATAFFSVLTALGTTHLLWPLMKPYPASPFFAAVVVSSWGGLGPGLVATLLSAVAMDYFFLPPLYQFSPVFSDYMRLSVFVVVSILTSSLSGARRRAETQFQEHAQLAAFTAAVARCVIGPHTLCAMLQRIAETMVQHLDAASVRLWTVTETGDALKLQASAGTLAGRDGPYRQVAINDPVLGRIARECRP